MVWFLSSMKAYGQWRCFLSSFRTATGQDILLFSKSSVQLRGPSSRLFNGQRRYFLRIKRWSLTFVNEWSDTCTASLCLRDLSVCERWCVPVDHFTFGQRASGTRRVRVQPLWTLWRRERPLHLLGVESHLPGRLASHWTDSCPGSKFQGNNALGWRTFVDRCTCCRFGGTCSLFQNCPRFIKINFLNLVSHKLPESVRNFFFNLVAPKFPDSVRNFFLI